MIPIPFACAGLGINGLDAHIFHQPKHFLAVDHKAMNQLQLVGNAAGTIHRILSIKFGNQVGK
jgi:hypothetical protein